MPKNIQPKTIYRPEYEQLIQELKSAREQQGISQNELGVMLSQDQTYVSKYETGIRRLDLIETMDICKALKLSVVSLIEGLEI